jgi:hypothetical protein
MSKNKNKDTDGSFFPEKWSNKLPTGFADEADAMDADQLKSLIVMSESNIYEIEKERENDVKLNAAKELVKEISGPYNDAVKTQTAKVKYALFLLEGKGIDLSNRDE